MPLGLSLLTVLAISMWVSAKVASPIAESRIVGTWECGPTIMHGPDFDLKVTEKTTNNADHTFITTTTSVITPHGGTEATHIDEAIGTWRLNGDIVTSALSKSTFLSSSDPTFDKEMGQQIQDAQLRKKSIYQSRLLEITANRSRSITTDSMYKEAEVESVCHRI